MNDSNILTIIIPARNEEGIILQTLKSIKDKVHVPYKILVVNDHSNDNTKELVMSFAKQNKNLSLIDNQKDPGFANALASGFEKADTNLIVVVMADFCDDPETINLMYEKMKEGWDVVCGSRYIKGGGKAGGPKLQGLFSYLVCRSLHLLIGIPTNDISNAFKMYRKSVLDNIKINSKSGVEASMEIILSAYFSNAKITDVPTFWKGRAVGKSKFRMFQRAPLYLKIYLWAVKCMLNKERIISST